jgi:hypothetical protein
MSVNQPPNPNVSTFNNLYWISADTALTTAQGDLRYLKWPVAQGTENLQTTNVQGVLTCNDDLVINNQTLEIDGVLGQIKYADNKVQNTAYTGGTSGTYTNTNMTIDANGKISAISNGSGGTNLLPLNNTWTGTQVWSNSFIGSLQSLSMQPPGTDNSNYIPTNAWVQSAIGAGGGFTTVTFELSADTPGVIPYTMPTTATSYNLIIVSFGGNGGLNTSSSLTSFMGGAGGAGQYVKYNNNTIETSRNYCYRFTKGVGGTSTNTIGVIWYKGTAGAQGDKLLQIYNGNNGTDAVGITPGTGGTPAGGSYKPTGTTLNTGSNAYTTGSVGQNGSSTPTSTPTLPLGGTISLAGYTTQGGLGVGQRTGGGGGIASSPPTKATIILQIFS